jgi:hypothetical protein
MRSGFLLLAICTALLLSACAPRHENVEPGNAEPAPVLSKEGTILLEKDAWEPSAKQYRGVRLLAGELSTALERGAAGIQLEAYAGAPRDESSAARQLSLRRATAVRQLLIDDGVPAARIDIRAKVGADDGGAIDRVDVFIRNATTPLPPAGGNSSG